MPDTGDGFDGKKFPCSDCISCQWCSDDRCRLCRGKCAASGRKLTLAEQIELFESLNREKPEV